jgi:hypothetical protein
MNDIDETAIDGMARIVLAGRKWKVPTLSPRQNRFIVPALLRVGHKFVGVQNLTAVGLELSDMDDLITICFHAISKAQPETTLEMFIDLEITVSEMTAALITIGEQTGILQKGAAKGEAPKGEATAQAAR